jgi:hypothetical protein
LVLAWLVAVVAAGLALRSAWRAFDSPKRSDGNAGHTTIDFGGQYLMGRMLVRGQGRHLYHRPVQRAILREAYPREDEDPAQEQSDAEKLMGWFMGRDDAQAAATIGSFVFPLGQPDAAGGVLALAAADHFWRPGAADQAAAAVAPLMASDPLAAALTVAGAKEGWAGDRIERVLHPPEPAVGGPLYPPINCLVYYPLALLRPDEAYRADQVLGVLLAFVAALGVRLLSQGRIWVPVAATAILYFPGSSGSLVLGQNSGLTLAILLWGWTLMARGHPVAGGAVWGLLAFKPVWALAFFLAPLLTGRWRFGLAMLGTGALVGAATLPFVGLHGWREWLIIGHEATEVYKADYNWIFLSRDLLSIPRRWLDFSESASWDDRRDNVATTLIGWAILLAVLEMTVRLAVLRRDRVREVTGPGAAFLLLGCWLVCFHFIYYDLLLAALPVLLLFTEPRQYLELRFLAIVPFRGTRLGPALEGYFQPRQAEAYPPPVPPLPAWYRHLWVLNRTEPTLVAVLVVVNAFWGGYNLPWETFFLIALWLWCGGLCLRRPRMADVAGQLPALALVGPPLAAPQLVELGADVGRAH